MNVSTNIEELRKLVTIEPGVEVAQWEIFGTPEGETGGLGPTDFLSVIFVGPTTGARSGLETDESQKVDFLPPNAVRGWLGNDEKDALQRMLSRKRLAANTVCSLRSFHSEKSNKAVEGFTCSTGSSTLYFVLLAEPAS